MKKLSCLLFTMLAFIITNANAKASLASLYFTPKQTEEIQKIVRDYIVNNPDVILEAGKKLQEQEVAKSKAQTEQIKANLPRYKQELFSTTIPGRTVAGNSNGKIIIVEFTQHQCPHCKTVVPIIDQLLKDNSDIQLITIYWPFFGNDAVYAAKAVLAAQKQDKFNKLNQPIITAQEFMTKDKIDSIIKSTPGIDIKQLYADMNTKEFDDSLKANFKLAENLGLKGAPTFIFTNKDMTKFSLILGQTRNMEKDLKKSLDEVR
jgi:protein-disulfide isomerase